MNRFLALLLLACSVYFIANFVHLCFRDGAPSHWHELIKGLGFGGLSLYLLKTRLER